MTRLIIPALVAFTILIVAIPNKTGAEYRKNCGLYARILASASDQYQNARSDLKTACGPGYGHSTGIQEVCGALGNKRKSVKRAKSELDSAINSVAVSCGPGDAVMEFILQLKTENRKLKAKIKSLSKAK